MKRGRQRKRRPKRLRTCQRECHILPQFCLTAWGCGGRRYRGFWGRQFMKVWTDMAALQEQAEKNDKDKNNADIDDRKDYAVHSFSRDSFAATFSSWELSSFLQSPQTQWSIPLGLTKSSFQRWNCWNCYRFQTSSCDKKVPLVVRKDDEAEIVEDVEAFMELAMKQKEDEAVEEPNEDHFQASQGDTFRKWRAIILMIDGWRLMFDGNDQRLGGWWCVDRSYWLCFGFRTHIRCWTFNAHFLYSLSPKGRKNRREERGHHLLNVSHGHRFMLSCS